MIGKTSSSSKPELSQAPEGFLEIACKPSAQHLQEYYNKKYFQLGLGSYEVSYSQAELSYFENRLDRFYFLVQDHLPADKKLTLLDIGCGEGFASAYFSRKGFDICSVDYSSAGVAQQNPQILQSHLVGDIFEILSDKIIADEKYDLLILQNVLEHVIDPRSLCQMMKRLLTDGGLALITVPNDFSLTQLTALDQQRISTHFWVCPPDHLNYFNTSNISDFIVSMGFSVLDIISDFPVDFFLFHEDSNYIQDRSKGKSAHFARIAIENMIHSAPIENVVNFYRAAASLGIGRDLTVLVKPLHD